jgi:hypothetical protein
MSQTHGGKKSKRFTWKLVGRSILIENENGKKHSYDIQEIQAILRWLNQRFGNSWFPLANNVELMGNGKEKSGLGMAILSRKPKDVTHAQGSSYLGVVLEEVGILIWNGAIRGIKWQIANIPETYDDVVAILQNRNG